jgi:hypothetical protein
MGAPTVGVGTVQFRRTRELPAEVAVSPVGAPGTGKLVAADTSLDGELLTSNA